jgi:hypothetical protein
LHHKAIEGCNNTTIREEGHAQICLFFNWNKETEIVEVGNSIASFDGECGSVEVGSRLL